MKKTIITVVAAVAIVMAQVSVAQASSNAEYDSGKGCYKELFRLRARAEGSAWKSCIDFFEGYYRNYPESQKASSALYSSGRLKQESYRISGDTGKLDGSIKDYNELIRQFPESSLADDALYRVGCMRQDVLNQPDRARRAFAAVLERYPHGDMAVNASARIEKLGPGTKGTETRSEDASSTAGTAVTETTSIAAETATPTAENRPAVADADVASSDAIEENDLHPTKDTSGGFESSAGTADAFSTATLMEIVARRSGEKTVVELVLDKGVEHSVEFTGMGIRTGSPPELDLVLLHTKPSDKLIREMILQSHYVASYKVKRLILSSGIKVVFKLKPDSGYDVRKTGSGIAVAFGPPNVATAVRIPAATSGSATKISDFTIVIDPGHGGPDDEGAVGPKGTKEKDVTLAMAKRLANDLRRELGARIYLTRKSDRAVSLEERNAITVKRKADLFISIHANASLDRDASGIETYYLNNATDAAAAKLAARENKSSKKNLSEVEHIISTMLQNYDAGESMDLANHVQGKLAKKLGRSHRGVKDRGVRSALFYVLVGAKCPAILVETAFISNPREEKLLRNDKYQRNVADAIADGVKGYLKVRDKALVSL